jgi:hypothetical protein
MRAPDAVHVLVFVLLGAMDDDLVGLAFVFQ